MTIVDGSAASLLTEADTCRELVTPALMSAAWGAQLPATLERLFAEAA